MNKYIKRYPFSIVVLLLIIYLSFFRPPKLDNPIVDFPNFDKIVHFCMYFGLSVTLWWEFICSHRSVKHPAWYPWIYAGLCPILFGGAVEIFQSVLTDYRSGDWLDFVANSSGVIVASVVGKFVLPKLIRRNNRQ